MKEQKHIQDPCMCVCAPCLCAFTTFEFSLSYLFRCLCCIFPEKENDDNH